MRAWRGMLWHTNLKTASRALEENDKFPSSESYNSENHLHIIFRCHHSANALISLSILGAHVASNCFILIQSRRAQFSNRTQKAQHYPSSAEINVYIPRSSFVCVIIKNPSNVRTQSYILGGNRTNCLEWKSNICRVFNSSTHFIVMIFFTQSRYCVYKTAMAASVF